MFWLAHVYSGAVAHLGDAVEADDPFRTRLGRALHVSLRHSWGMLGAALVPVLLLSLGALGAISHEQAIWGTLWADVVILGLLGYLGVSSWTPRRLYRVWGGLITALFGVVLILLKALIH